MCYDEHSLRPVIQGAFDQGGIDAVVQVVVALLQEQECRHKAAIAKLESRIGELEKRLNKNSSNSSKPPSSDGLNRKRSLRPKNSGRKPGGQPGHPGQHLSQRDTPDSIVTAPLDNCPECGWGLGDEGVVAVEKRQVFDLPPIQLHVTEYQAHRKVCPKCQQLVTAAFPDGVRAPAQYGPGLQAVLAYLNVRQLIPCGRVVEICEDLFNHRPSAGSVVNAGKQCADGVAAAVDIIRDQLRAARVLHSDETGVRCEGQTQWLHVACTPGLTLYSHSHKRGVEGFVAGDVLPTYDKTLVHDFWGPYDTLNCNHARCNVHLSRELKSCIEDGNVWAQELADVLLAMKKATDEAREKGWDVVPAAHRKRFERDYDRAVAAGFQVHPERVKSNGKPGRVKQSKETNLLKRLRDKREEVLRFLHELDVPFDNNQAERDLRMIKVQQKVSGCFRSEEGARRFCLISSYISTARKQGVHLMKALKAIFSGKPVPLAT